MRKDSPIMEKLHVDRLRKEDEEKWQKNITVVYNPKHLKSASFAHSVGIPWGGGYIF